jgi:hypothetical protein
MVENLARYSQLPLKRPMKHGLKQSVKILAAGGLGGFKGAEFLPVYRIKMTDSHFY